MRLRALTMDVTPPADRAALSPPLPALADSAVAVHLLPSSKRPQAGQIWQDLEARVPRGALTCSWDWTESWLNHYGDLVPHRFALGERQGVPCGMALLTEGVGQRRGPFAIRTLHLGTAGEPAADSVHVEYNRLLVQPGDQATFATALVEAIRRDASWDELILDGLAPEEAAALLVAEPALVPRRTTCLAFDLRAARKGEGEIVTALTAGVRKKVRRNLRAFEPIATEWAESTEQALDILDELVALHQRRWLQAGKPGVFSSARFAGFHRELVQRLLPRAGILLFRARADGKTLGCIYGFIEHQRALFYQSGLALLDSNQFSPGYVVNVLCMQACLERGLDEYNFLAGDSQYKRELSTVERELVWATAQRRRPKLLLINGLRRVKRWLRRQ